MDLVYVFLIALGLAMDAFAVSIANGMAMKKLKVRNMLKFGLYFGVAQGLMPVIGYFLAKQFLGSMAKYSGWIGFVLLFLIGIKMIIESVRDNEDTSHEETDISGMKMLILAIATSIDAMAVGVSFALMGNSLIQPAIIIAVVTFAVSAIGVFIGNKIGSLLKKGAGIFGGWVLILMGVKILLDQIL